MTLAAITCWRMPERWHWQALFWRAATLREPRDHFVTMDQKPYRLDDLRYLTPGSFFSTYPYYPQGYMQQWNFAIAPASRK